MMNLKLILFLIFIIFLLVGCNQFNNKEFFKGQTKMNSLEEEQEEKMLIIESYTFGSIKIEGNSYGDIKIFQNKITSWVYIKRHTITVEDIAGIITGTEYLIIGAGTEGRVKVEQAVLNLLAEKKIQVSVKETAEAVEEYNALVKENKNVAAILHSTC